MEKAVLKIEQVAHVLKLLGDKTRLTMVGMMYHHECCVCEFVEIFDMSQPAISQHLRKLRDVGLVREKRKGQWIFYSLNMESKFYPLIETILTHIPDQRDKINDLEKEGKRMICD